MRLLKLGIVLVVLGLAGLAGYAYLGDMDARQTEVRVPVAIDLSHPPTPQPAATAVQTENKPATTKPGAKGVADTADAKSLD